MLERPPLNPRQKQVLKALVNQFIARNEPISSRALSLDPLFRASSATIRNTMAELEELGLVRQPHTSAGRQPTDRGYRTYVQELPAPPQLPMESRALLQAELEKIQAQSGEEQEVLTKTAQLLSRMTNLLAVVMPPALENGTFQHLTVVPVAEDRVLIVLSASDRLTKSRMIEAVSESSIYRLEALAQKISRQIRGRPVALLNALLHKSKELSLSEEESKAFNLLDRSISKLIDSSSSQELWISGAKNILALPDFEKIEDVQGLLELLDSKITMVHFLRQRSEYHGVHVTIGEEHRNGQFRTLSIITSAFRMGAGHGILGVIGPKRMAYGPIIALVDFVARAFARTEEEKAKPPSGPEADAIPDASGPVGANDGP